MTKIIFFGTSSFAAHVLESLAKKLPSSEYTILAIVTQPDKPVGRKQQMQKSSVTVSAEKLSLTVLKPHSLKTLEAENQLRNFNADLFIVAAYGKIIPRNILDIVNRGALNVHGSMLPKYRGASPIQRAILDGQKQTGVTVMLMDEQMDHGPILTQKTLTIGPDDTYPILEQKMADLGQNLLIETLSGYLNDSIKPREQEHALASATSIIEKADGKIDWSKNVTQIYNQYRAYFSWPGIWTTLNGQVLKVIKCAPYTIQDKVIHNFAADLAPGTVQQEAKNIFVSCGKDFLQLCVIQLEGKKITSAESFVAGHRDFIGSQLGK